MEIKIDTKYNIGDLVYFMNRDKVDKGLVIAANIKVEVTDNKRSQSNTTIIYIIEGYKAARFEKELFSSKEELISSL